MSEDASRKRVAAVVPAAGMSRRMGRLKPLLPFDGQPMLARVIDLWRKPESRLLSS